MKLKVTRKQLSTRSLRGAILARLDAKYRSYERDEDGGIAIVAFFIFLLMVTMGGISVDLMRHEMERSQLQATLDSAVLAGAGAPAGSTKAEIKEIVEDFFAKSGKSDYLDDIGDDDINATLNARLVKASADITMNTYLMKLMGVDTLTAAGGATAQVRTPKLEIIMVLDVSGSMAGTRLANLKIAAKEFVTTVLSSSDPGSTVISIVPYSWGVSPTEGMFDAMNITRKHDYSSCVVFEDEDYNTTVIDDQTVYHQRIYTSRYGTNFDRVGEGELSNFWSSNYYRTCYTDDYFEILPFSINEGILHAKIESLQAAGSTSAHLGMKWAAGMLDPDFEPIMTALQTPRAVGEDDGETIFITEVDPTLTNIPAAYEEPDTQKVIILMGDGQNDSTYMFEDPYGLLDRDIASSDGTGDYRGPGSYLHELVLPETVEEEFDYAYDQNNHSRQWHQSWAENYCYLSWLVCVYEQVSYENPDSGTYIYNPNNGYYYREDYNRTLSSYQFNIHRDSVAGQTYVDEQGAERPRHENFSWEHAWGRMTPEFVGNLTGNWAPSNEFTGNVQTTAMKDTKMTNICNAVGEENVIVYSIGFEVTENGHAETQLRNCATDTTKYYRASLVSITDAFGSIAANVQNLRLTQ